MNPNILRNTNGVVLDAIAYHTSELSELLKAIKKVPSSQKNAVAGILDAANAELGRRGQITSLDDDDQDTQPAEVQ